MLTKKDFKAVAEIIRSGHEDENDNWNSGRWDASKIIADKLADYFATQNPRLDRSRFMKACGLTSK